MNRVTLGVALAILASACTRPATMTEGEARPPSTTTPSSIPAPVTITIAAGPPPTLTIPRPSIPDPDVTVTPTKCGGHKVDIPEDKVLFIKGSAQLPATAATTLQPIADSAIAGKAEVTVEAFASVDGDQAFNLTLIENRVAAVVAFFQQANVTKVTAKEGAILGVPTDPPDVLASYRKVTVTLQPTDPRCQ